MSPFKSMAGAFALVAALSFAGCPGGGGGESDVQSQGDCQYKDAQTTPSGQAEPPAKPAPQPDSHPMTVEIHMSGTGDITGLAPKCALPGASSYQGLLTGEGTVDQSGGYVALFSSNDATFELPDPQCAVPDLKLDVLTSVEVRGKLETTTRNCQDYCSAKARSAAEAQCQGSANQVSCRSAAESSFEASCTQQCNGKTTRRIVADTRLTLQQLAQLNAQGVGLEALGDLEVDLTFDKIQDFDDNGDGQVTPAEESGDGQTVNETSH